MTSSTPSQPTAAPTKRLLAIVTSTPEYATTGYRTGLWLGELTHFYDKVTQAGYDVTVASIAGGQVPIDPESLSKAMLAMGGTGKRYRERAFMDLLDHTVSVNEVHADDFDAIYLTGGHGVMYDFDHPALGALLTDFDRQGKVVSAVCHGPAGLVHATRADGSAFLAGRQATGFSWLEELLAGRRKAVPFRLDEAMQRAGASYSTGRLPMLKHVVVDGRLVTGQNPTSAAGVAEAVLELLGHQSR